MKISTIQKPNRWVRGGGSIILLLPACALQASSSADSSMGGALLAAHFKARAAVTDAQRDQLRNLPDHRFTVVKQDGGPISLPG